MDKKVHALARAFTYLLELNKCFGQFLSVNVTPKTFGLQQTKHNESHFNDFSNNQHNNFNSTLKFNGRELASLRMEANLSIDQVAHELNMSTQEVSLIELNSPAAIERLTLEKVNKWWLYCNKAISGTHSWFKWLKR